ncbi:MAG TPA: radical SAM/SPASM domain-containing protein [Clostridiales bacterium]|nr:radical SAM/SPASM domain-containing protein [Clostridiales bacterium]
MKPSLYNFIYDYPDDKTKHILYNSLSGALALVEEEKHDIFYRFSQYGESINDSNFLNDLEKGGYIVEDSCNELDMFSYKSLKMKYSNDAFALTIAPTSDCNFRCIYCYEKNSNKYPPMNEEIQDKIIKLCESKIPNIKLLRVSWYGGEPLLAMSAIENISNKLIEMCKKNNVDYSASIVTNGYLLTSEVYKRLISLKVNSIQITVDGSEDEHNKRRPLVGGKATFKTILDNLCSIRDCKVDEKINIALSINVDKTNVDGINNTVAIFKENNLSEFLYTYISKVRDSNNSFNKNLCFCTEEFSDLEYKFINENFNKNVLINLYPKILYNVCGADRDNSLVIDPNGDLYKCWEDIGVEEYKIGNIMNDKMMNQSVFYNYMLYDATTDSECSSCKYLPLCNGGCPRIRTYNSNDRCLNIKYILERQIIDTSTNIIKDRENKSKINIR